MLYRKDKHWSQSDLGKAAGISRNYVSMIEGDDANVTLGTLEAVCAALGISVSIVLCSSESHLTKRPADGACTSAEECNCLLCAIRRGDFVVPTPRR